MLIVGLAQLPLIVRWLRPELAGLWLLFLNIGSYIAWFDLGLCPTVGRQISFALAAPGLSHEQRNGRIAELLTTLWRTSLVLAVCIGLACLGVGEFVITRSSGYGSITEAAWAWAIFSVGVSINLFGGTALAGLYGLGYVAAEKVIRSLALVLGLGLSVTVLMLNWGIVGLSVGWTLQGIALSALAFGRLLPRCPTLWNSGIRPNWRLLRELAGSSLKLALIQLGGMLILQSADPLIAIRIGASAIPPYEAVSKIVLAFMTTALLVVNSSSPFFSMAYAGGNSDRFLRLLFTNLRVGLGIIILLCTFTAANGERLISLWVGPSMFAGNAVLWVLLAMVLLEVHHVIFATAVLAADKVVFVAVALGSGLLNIVLALVLAGRLGLLGIALAVAIGQVLTNNWYVPYFAIRLFNIRALTVLREIWVPLLALLAIQIGVNFMMKTVPPLGQNNWRSLALDFVVTAVIGAVVWCLVALPSSERAEVREWIRGSSVLKAEGV